MKLSRTVKVDLPTGHTTVCVPMYLMQQVLVQFCRSHDVTMLGEMLPSQRRAYVLEMVMAQYIEPILNRPIGVAQSSWDKMSGAEKVALLDRIAKGIV